VIEAPAAALPALRRSVLDVGTFEKCKKLPLIADLLSSAAEHGRGEYLIYTNMDIGPQPQFYRVAARMAERGRALAINRRTIDGGFQGPEDLERMYAEKGRRHEGHDCFVFPRQWVGKLRLGKLCIGAPWWDWGLIANLEVLSGWRMCVYLHQRLTFHIGNEKTWLELTEYDLHNRAELERILEELRGGIREVPEWSQFDRFWRKVKGEAPRRKTVGMRLRRKLRLVKEAKYLLLSKWMGRRSVRADAGALGGCR
jgi:hypothetical protein